FAGTLKSKTRQSINRAGSLPDARIHLHPSRPRWRLWMEHSFAKEVKYLSFHRHPILLLKSWKILMR
ncbi:MAG TPA: hypothetical protein VKD91_03105, partial [Pyrinomonadaceae bacterium]|nr:hypothetical protein [Pyrinomonadaceae bacterium]